VHNYSKTIDYLSEFFSSRYPDYFEMMKDAGSAHYPPAFKQESEIIQGIRNVVHNISDNYHDLTIPKGFASPSMLNDALVGFRNMAEKQLNEAIAVNQSLGEPWYDVISQSVKINGEVKEAIDYALTLVDENRPIKSTSLERLIHLLNAIPKIADGLKSRRKESGTPRPTLTINDEYDVQDLMRAILAIEFDDIRPEEWSPSYAGGSKRMDFLLKEESIVVEVKKTSVPPDLS
jgi:hypothetical protein